MRRVAILAALAVAGCGSRTMLLDALESASASGSGSSRASGVSATSGTSGASSEHLDAGVPPRVDAGACSNASRPWLLFALSGEDSPSLYAMRSDGSEGHAVSLAYEFAGYVSISNDGTKVLYVISDADAGETETLILEDLRSRVAKPIISWPVSDSGEVTYSSLSADGQTVAYTLGLNVRVVGVDGEGDRLVLPLPGEDAGISGHPLFVGNTTTFLYGADEAFGSVHADGSDDVTLVGEDGPGYAYPNPAISPDLANVAAAIGCADGAGTWLRVYPYSALPARCESGRKLVRTSGMSAEMNGSANPSWGPTNLIAYADGQDVYVVDAETGAVRNMTAALTSSASGALDPLWAPGCGPTP